MNRKPYIAGNWKMNKTVAEAAELARRLAAELGDVQNVDITVCPTAVCIPAVVDALEGTSISVGAQNMHWEKSGAFTGELSADMILSTGAEVVIIGHSERRAYFGETNETVNKKLTAALASGLRPIVCVGETLEQREKEQTEDVVRSHVTGAFESIPEDEAKKVTVAYEPVWAIGTGKTATPEQAQEVHSFIRGLLGELYSASAAREIRIQYGGSVKPGNVAELMAQEDLDGALVGGASLKVDSFAQIVRFERR